MHEHAAYWTALMDEGHVQVFGPVLDPEGAFGMGVVSAENEAEVEKLLADDPALKLRMTHKVSPMRAILPTTS